MNRSNTQTLFTDHLEIAAGTLEHVCAELEGAEKLAAILDAVVPAGWPPGEYDRSAQEYFRDRLREGGSPVIGWYVWYAIQRSERGKSPVLIGSGGYMGPPKESGEVEIGFSIVRAWQKRGYATELVNALIARAMEDSRVRKIVAHTTPENRASCRVLEKCGFQRIGNAMKNGSIRYEIISKKPV